MDERLRISLWMIGGGGLGSVLGGAFGALTGAMYARNGGAAGTALGRRVADALTRIGERELSRVRRAALIGAADGFVFLGMVGIVAGVLAATFGPVDPRGPMLMALGVALLVGAAALFGTMAYIMARRGVSAVMGVFAGGLLGSFLAGVFMGADHCLFGVIPGLLAGLLCSLAWR